MSTCVSRCLLKLANLDPKAATLGPIAYPEIPRLACALGLYLTPLSPSIPRLMDDETYLALIHEPFAACGHCIIITTHESPEYWDPETQSYYPLSELRPNIQQLWHVTLEIPTFMAAQYRLTQTFGQYPNPDPLSTFAGEQS